LNCIGYAKRVGKRENEKPHAQIYQRLRKLFPEVPTKYIKPMVFGGRRLCKNHLTGNLREGLKEQ
jgi:hypothetical protein